MLGQIVRWLDSVRGKGKKKKGKNGIVPVVIPRAKHGVSRANISKAALKVLYRLKDAGFQAYLVGGGVRDVLLEMHPKDFDVATDARPEQVQNLFQNCRLIGRRFRLAHVHFGSYIVEVATFRANSGDISETNPHLVHSEAGMILRDNIYGTLEEDVMRRDFTINALYYNIADFSVMDFVGGIQDLNARSLRIIGDPRKRFREDPVRMLRAIRFAAKLNFEIESSTKEAIYELGDLVKQVPSARLIDECMKLFLSGFAEASFKLLRHYNLFSILFPETEYNLKQENGLVERFVMAALLDTDKRVTENRPVALPFLLAALLWHSVEKEAHKLIKDGMSELTAFYEACDLVLKHQQKSVSISKRMMQAVREIWVLQPRLMRRTGKRVLQVFSHPRFRAAYDFMTLRAIVGEARVVEVVEWWKQYLISSDEDKDLMNQALKTKPDQYRRTFKKRV